jgi:exopolysaccharide biosynthesis polyprenyl glycosylphosphotransferase
MSYKSFHIALLLILIALDIVVVNLAGIGSFWVRCRTATFSEPQYEVTNLTGESLPIWGTELSIIVHKTERRAGIHKDAGTALLSASFGSKCFIQGVTFVAPPGLEQVIWSLAAGDDWSVPRRAALVTEQLSDSSAQYTLDGIELTGTALSVGYVSPWVDDPDLSNIQILGYDTELHGLFLKPVVEVPTKPYRYLLLIWNVSALLGLLYCGAYRLNRSLEIVDDLYIVVKAVGVATVLVIVILFLHRGYQEATYLGFEFSRLVVIMGAFIAVLALTLNRLVVDQVHLFFLRRGVGIRKVIVVGAGPEGRRIVERLQTHYWLAYDPVGFVDDNRAVHNTRVVGLPVLGATHRLGEFSKSLGADEVIVALPNSSHKAVMDVVGRCAHEHLRFRILPSLFEVISSQVQVGALDGVPVLDVDDNYLGQWDRFLKRAIDLIGGLLLVTVLSPVFLVSWILIRATSRGPAVFVQQRIGSHGKAFPCYKFRSMTLDSGEQDAENRATLFRDAMESTSGGKVVNPSRVTWVGTFLRRFSLDEMPQLFNVLKGEMSLVGPRPPIPYEIRHYNTWHLGRLKGKPGMTGLWQVSGRAELPFEEMVKLDLYYLKHWSLWLDSKILLKTIPAVFTGRGAS